MKNYNYSGVFKYIKDLIEEECDETFDVFDIEDVYITQVIYKNPATIVFWSDGTKTVSKCHGDDIYSRETGLSICVLKKLVGSTPVHNLFKDWVNTQSKTKDEIKISDVRMKYKNSQH